MSTTRIRNAAWIIAWDSTESRHVYLRDADIVFSEDRILSVGGGYTGGVDEEIDGSNRLVMPGLVNAHCHPAMQPLFRGYTEEFGNPRLFNSGRHLFRQAFFPDEEAKRASAEFAIAELLAGGVTTICDLSNPYSGWIDILAESGIRACVAPMYRSARWYTDTGQETQYEWYDDGGQAALRQAIEVMDEADAHASGRLFSMVSPAQVDTCTEELLRDSIALAHESERPLFIHAAQSFAEFNGMTRRNNMTPVEWLSSLGFLSPRTTLGHAVFTDEHPWLHWPTRRDLALIAESGTSIAHCPMPFLRDGTLLHDLGHYADRGINFGIGTDTHPHNMIEEIRHAELLARAAAGPTHTSSTERVFGFATIGGAHVLNRDDIGRLAAGARADVVTIDLSHPSMHPLADPLRSLIYSAADRAVDEVYVAGRRLVRAGRVLTIDRDEAARRILAGQQRAIAGVCENDPGRRSIDALLPRSLPEKTSEGC